MSRSAGSFAGFFPSAPSVQQQKRKRAAASRDRSDAIASSHTSHSVSNSDRDQTSALDGHHKRRRTSNHEQVPEEQIHINGDAGDLLNGVVGSASSTSTVSSVFSNGAPGAMSSGHVAGATPQTQTPLTVDESSPPRRSISPHHGKTYSIAAQVNGDHLSPHCPIQEKQRISGDFSSKDSSPRVRVRALPNAGEIKGERVYYDPQLDPKYKKPPGEEKKAKYRSFGQVVSKLSSIVLSNIESDRNLFRIARFPRILGWQFLVTETAI